MSNGQSVLGIQVEAKGVTEAAERLAGITDDLKAIEKETAQASEASRKLAEANQKAFKDSADAVMSLGQAENAIWAEQQKLKNSLEEIHNLVNDVPKLPISTPEEAQAMREAAEAAEEEADKLEALAHASELLQNAGELFSGITDSLKNYASAVLDAYKPLEEARQQLKFFVQSAQESEDIIQHLTSAAAEWGQSKTALTQVASELAKNDLNVKNNLEAVVKLAVASKQDLTATAEVFSNAVKGDEKALKTLQEEYKLNTYQIKQYGIEIDKAGKVTAETEEQQEKLAHALSEIAKTQYGDAIAQQQETLAGSIERLETAIDNAKSVIGESIAPVITTVANKIGELVNSFNSLPPELQKGIGSLTVFAGSLTLMGVGLAKTVTWGLQAATAIEGLSINLSKYAAEIAKVTQLTTEAATGTANFSAKALSAAKPIGNLALVYAAVAYELSNLYAQEQKLKGQELLQESRVDTAYAQAVREVNSELQKIGLSLDDISNKSKQNKIIEFLGDTKKSAIDLNSVLDAMKAKISQDEKKLDDLRNSMTQALQAKSALDSGNAESGSLWYGNLDYYNAKIAKEGLGGYGGFGTSEQYSQQDIDQRKKEYDIQHAIVELEKNKAEAIEKAVKWRAEEAERTKRILENEREQAKLKREQEQKDKEKSAEIKDKLAEPLEQSRNLPATDEGIKKAYELQEAYKRIGQANEWFISQQKDLQKAYEKGLSALDKQITKLEKQKELADQRAAAEKEFTAQSERHEALKGKSLEEQKQGLSEIAEHYKNLLQYDDNFLKNADNRKKAESEIKKITAERLSIEEKIAELQKDANQRLKDAQLKTQEQTLQRLEAEKAHLEKTGKEAEAKRKEAEIQAQKEKIRNQKEANDIQDIYNTYDQKLAQAKGNQQLTDTLLKARSQEIANIKDTYNQQRTNETWKVEEEKYQKAIELSKQTEQVKTSENIQTQKVSNSLDKLSKSADKASASLDKQTQNQNVNEWGGMKAKVQSGKPVEIIEQADTYKPNQTWEWTPSYEMIKVMDQIKGINLPSVGNPIPREMVNSKANQYNSYTNNVTVNGIPAANQTVDSRQIALHAANMAETSLSKKLSANGMLNYG